MAQQKIAKLAYALFDPSLRRRGYANFLERTEALCERSRLSKRFLQKTKLWAQPIKAEKNLLSEGDILRIKSKLIKLHLREGSDHLAVSVRVGRGLKSHVHEFHSHYNAGIKRLDISFYDPEGYIGRRDSVSPEITQIMTCRLSSEDEIALKFMRVSVADGRNRAFKSMNNLKKMGEFLADEKSSVVQLSDMLDGAVYYFLQARKLYCNASEWTGMEGAHHRAFSLNNIARQEQVMRVFAHMEALCDHGHMKPCGEMSRQIHRHCEPGATCR